MEFVNHEIRSQPQRRFAKKDLMDLVVLVLHELREVNAGSTLALRLRSEENQFKIFEIGVQKFDSGQSTSILKKINGNT